MDVVYICINLTIPTTRRQTRNQKRIHVDEKAIYNAQPKRLRN